MKRFFYILAALTVVAAFLPVKASKMAVDIMPLYAKVWKTVVPPNEVEIGPNPVFYETPVVDEDKELEGVQVPVPRKDRVVNTKGNCVWCSLELLGRYAEIKKLYNITKNPPEGDRRCQGGSSPSPVRSFLDAEKIKYEMIEDRRNTAFLVRGCKTERRGVAFDVPGHMLTLVHYDPDTKIVKVIDNADHSLSVQTWSWEKFHSRWGGWAYIIYGEPDIIPSKYFTFKDIPFKDGVQRHHDYFPVPEAA